MPFRPCRFSAGRPAEGARGSGKLRAARRRGCAGVQAIAGRPGRRLPAWLAVAVDGDRLARGRAQLHPMRDALEGVRDIPECRRSLVWNRLAVPHVLVGHGWPAAADISADRRAGDRAPGRGHIPSDAATDLVAENAAEDPADDRAAHVGAAIVDDLLLLHPAALL